MNSGQISEETNLFDYKDEKISIVDFEKQIATLNKDSIDDVLDAVSEISNKNYLPFITISRILRTVVPRMVKSKKFTADDIENYMFSFVEIINNQNNTESITRIASIIKFYSLDKSINFLENRITYFQDIKADRTKIFDIAIALSDSYHKKKDFENAFKELRRASLFVNNPTEQADYLWKLRIINENSAIICFNEPKPKHDFFLIYYLVAFALDIARDLTFFPHLSPFFYRNKNQFSPDNGDDEDDDINMSLKQLNIIKYKKEIFREYNNFIYNELPIIYGIPLKYNEDSLSRILSSVNTDEFWSLINFSEELHNKSIDIIPYKTYDFVSTLLKEYYDKENP